MITIDTNLLTQLGITVPADQEDAFLQHLYDTLEERVGAAMVELLTDDEVKELLELQDQDDDKAVADWLTKHVPNYEDVVKDEFEILMAEAAESSKETKTAE